MKYRIPSDGWKWTLFGGLAITLIVLIFAILRGA